ncbi:nicotinate-nucleotide--dimethylbenzimidazole phosphoribosyltransferase [Sphingomonas endophytica]|uniref:Nicotinate-nucleotide--dimethylbenzimidazole phosphoribosyltransferase n=1 Tax=Sphingomonas endophytica TaxID=869719 RepID=A0A7X0JB98_9SPHN|nr:nicotinate-nucleotide--dimethylbenzimidazole phosphoribosyltransferase [Sphingomonas endophytica]MBB6504445.1 nicotinate-nucleotide--dimethylbenzimidazole phosphoribosyltransferase [Sphingomonas endophytica]
MRLDSVAAFDAALAELPAPDAAMRAAAAARQTQLTKPAGSLGRLEEIALFMAGWQRDARPRIDDGQVVIFAGNHGVAARGVSAFPPAVTAQMVANFTAGGAAINALAAAAGLSLTVVPLALDQPTGDITREPAMSEAECLDALDAGAAAVRRGTDLLVPGDMGIGNTTPAAALCAASFGGTAVDWVGPGTGVHGAALAAKIAAVDAALACHADATTPFERLRRLGGREIAAIAGAILAARHARIPVLLDGFIVGAALAPLAAARPRIVDHCLAGHVSAEPGHTRLLDRLGLAPLLRLDMRLGEASGAAVAAGIVRAALTAHDQMATFDQAGVAEA